MSHELILALKQQIVSTDWTWKIKLQNWYWKLLKTLKIQNLDNYLWKWERTYTDCKKLNFLNVDDNHSLFNFLNVISEIISEFSEYWLHEIQKKQDKRKILSDLYKIVKLFCNNMKIININVKRNAHVFTDIFQDKLINDSKINDSKINEKSDKKNKLNAEAKSEKFECICDKKHLFQKCFYLVKSIQLKNWKSNAEKQKKIDKKTSKEIKKINQIFKKIN